MAKIANLIVTFFLLFVLDNTIIKGEEPIGGVDFPGSSIRCYFGTGTGITSSVSCPRYSLGCIKRVSCKCLLKNWVWFLSLIRREKKTTYLTYFWKINFRLEKWLHRRIPSLWRPRTIRHWLSRRMWFFWCSIWPKSLLLQTRSLQWFF